MCRGSQRWDHGDVSSEEDGVHQHRNQRGDSGCSRGWSRCVLLKDTIAAVCSVDGNFLLPCRIVSCYRDALGATGTADFHPGEVAIGGQRPRNGWSGSTKHHHA